MTPGCSASRHPQFDAFLSVVIPTRNEGAELTETLRRVRLLPEVKEILIVDAGSRDDTPNIAEDFGCRWLECPASRGGQMHLGGTAATGEAILFLHADTWVEPNAGAAIAACLQDPAVVGGACLKRFRPPADHWLLAIPEWKCRLRFFLFRRCLGDQGLFARKVSLDRIGGFPDLPIMEEFEFCRRLRRFGRLRLAPTTVSTSTRKFQRLGVARTYLLMSRVTLGYWLGQSPHSLKRLYEHPKGERLHFTGREA